MNIGKQKVPQDIEIPNSFNPTVVATLFLLFIGVYFYWRRSNDLQTKA